MKAWVGPARIAVLLALGQASPLGAQAGSRWTEAYVNQWIAVLQSGAVSTDNTMCENLFTTAATGLEVAHSTAGVWWMDLPDPPGEKRYGRTTHEGQDTKMMVDATKARPLGGIPATVAHEGAHASRDPKYNIADQSDPDEQRRLKNIIEPMLNSEVDACYGFLTNIPLIPASN